MSSQRKYTTKYHPIVYTHIQHQTTNERRHKERVIPPSTTRRERVTPPSIRYNERKPCSF